jgi:hypothetical protein
MRRWIRGPDLDREPGRELFDPVVEGARYDLSRELSLVIWERTYADATDGDGQADADQARQRFHDIAARIAARGGRTRPEAGKMTRVGIEIEGGALGASGVDELAIHTPGRETLVTAEAPRWTRMREEPPPATLKDAEAAMGRPMRAHRPGARLDTAARATDPTGWPGKQTRTGMLASEHARLTASPRPAIQGKGIDQIPTGEIDLEPTGSGEPLLPAVRAKMEAALGMDFSAVRIHTGPQADQVGALAFARGNDIFFAPGQYQPGTERGQELLAHELTHIVQQATGRTGTSREVGGVRINDDPGLEREADEMGAKAARAEDAASRSLLARGPGQPELATSGSAQRPEAARARTDEVAPLEATRATSAVVFRATVTPVPASRHNKLALLGDGTPANRGLTVSALESYVARQADWFTEPSLTQADRDKVWKVLLLLHEGSHVGVALGSLRVAEVAAVSPADLTKLRTYASGFDSNVQTIQLNTPVGTMARALQLGQAVIDLAVFVPAPVLRVVIPESGLIFLVDHARITELQTYYRDFTPTLEAPAEWTHVEAVLNEGIATYAPLARWVHDLHVFTLPARRRLLVNVGNTTRALPVMLILLSGSDWNTAFLQATNLEASILDPHNLALVVQGPTSLAHATAEVTRIANDYGQRTTSFDWNSWSFVHAPGRLGQVVIAGHGSDQTVEMATSGTGATAQRDHTYVSYNEQQIDSSNPVASGTQALIDTVLQRLDPAAANIVFAGCLVGSHDIPAGTNVANPATAAANLRTAIAGSPNLADYVRQRMTTLGITGQVQAANASTTFGAFNLDAAGHARLHLSWDPNISAAKLAYVQTGMEPEGALRAALEIYADPAIGPAMTTSHMRTRVTGLAGNTDWWATITRLGYQLALPPAPADVNVGYLLDLSHRISAWFFGGWASMINVQWMADNVTAIEAPTVFAGMLTTTTATQDHLAVGAREAWLKHVPGQAGPFMTALTASALTRRTFQPLLARAIVDPQLGTLLGVGGAPTKGQLLLALTIAVINGATMPAPVRNFLRAAAGGATTSSFPAPLGLGALLDGASELQILRDIGLAPAAAPVVGAPPPATVDGNLDVNQNNTNESHVQVEPHEATVNVNQLNVRSGPNATASVIDTVNTGDVVRVMGASGTWSLIDHAGRIGFVATRYLTP